MKNNKSIIVITLITMLMLPGCTDRFPSMYTLELPEVPTTWLTLLGEPNWRIEWITPNGLRQIDDFPPETSFFEIEIPVTWTNPVIAWPYWPSHSLLPGVFKPAGALFPFDVDTNLLRLSWEAGHGAIFYREMAFAYDQNDSRIPVNFDWLRFRELFSEGTLSTAVCEDPWVVDWRTVAERTIESGFDRRRIVAEAATLIFVSAPSGFSDDVWRGGRWHGTSPFAKPLTFELWEPTLFPVRPGINVWVSELGILRVSGNSWVFQAADNNLQESKK